MLCLIRFPSRPVPRSGGGFFSASSFSCLSQRPCFNCRFPLSAPGVLNALYLFPSRESLLLLVCPFVAGRCRPWFLHFSVCSIPFWLCGASFDPHSRHFPRQVFLALFSPPSSFLSLDCVTYRSRSRSLRRARSLLPSVLASHAFFARPLSAGPALCPCPTLHLRCSY